MSYEVVKVEPVGQRTGPAFVMRKAGCSLENVTSPIYPENPQGKEMRRVRIFHCVGLGVAARALGMQPVDLSGVEMGRVAFANQDDYARAIAMIHGLRATIRGTTP